MSAAGLGTSPQAQALADRLVATLPTGRPGLFNPWSERCPLDEGGNTLLAKRTRLAQHLDCDPLLILCGEAPGYQGCRYSGIAFTSERLLLEGAIPRVTPPARRLTSRPRPWSEPSATIVWKALYRLGIAERVVLWNAVQLHPHRPHAPFTNRTPTDAELALGAPGIALLLAAFPAARTVAVGKKAQGLLRQMGVPGVECVRHPANGGATAFSDGLQSLIAQSCRR